MVNMRNNGNVTDFLNIHIYKPVNLDPEFRIDKKLWAYFTVFLTYLTFFEKKELKKLFNFVFWRFLNVKKI